MLLKDAVLQKRAKSKGFAFTFILTEGSSNMSKKRKLWSLLTAAMVCFITVGSISVSGKNAELPSGVREGGTVVDGTGNKAVSETAGEGSTAPVLNSEVTGYFSNDEDGDGFYIKDDGTFTGYKDFKNKKGKMLGTVLPEGDHFVFTSPGLEKGQVTGTFGESGVSFRSTQWTIDGKIYLFDYGPIEVTPPHFYDIYCNGKGLHIWGKSMKNLKEQGLKCREDMDRTLKSMEVSDEIKVTSGWSSAYVRVINPYENEVPLSDCLVCSFYTEDKRGKFRFESDGPKCGEDCFDDLLQTNVYIYEKEKLVYKEYILSFPEIESVADSDRRGKKIVDVSNNVELTFCFNGSKLKSFCFTDPKLLYDGLADNVDKNALERMSDEQKAEAIRIRNSIRARLIEAFKEAGVEAVIDETTGEIVMDTKILFGVDSFEISDEGKEYLDQFMSIYIPVLFADEFKEYIDQVRFDGHTDSVGSIGHNIDLSNKRAKAVLDYCLESSKNGLTAAQKDMLKDKAATEGHGSSDLIYDDNGDEDREASRRVTVKFFLDVE